MGHKLLKIAHALDVHVHYMASIWGHLDRVGPNLSPTCPIATQLKGQGRPSLTPVGFWLGQVGPLLSYLSYSLGAGGSHRKATRM